MNSMIQGLLGNLNQQAGMPTGGGLLGGGTGLLGYQAFHPNFDLSMFTRTPYQPQRFAAPNIPMTPQAPAAAPQQGLGGAGFLSPQQIASAPISPQQAAQYTAFAMPAAYKQMSAPEMYYAMNAGA